MDVKELREKLKSARERLQSLTSEGEGIYETAKTESRDLTDEEKKRVADINTEFDEAEAEVNELARRLAFQEHVSQARKSEEWLLEAEGFTANGDPQKEDRTNYHGWPVEEAWQFWGAVRARESNSLPKNMNDDLRETFIQAIEQRAPTGQGTIIDSEGGLLVPSTISSTLLRKTFTEGQVVSRTTPVPITVGNSTQFNAVKENARTSGSRFGGITVSPTGESLAATSSKAKFEGVKLELKKKTGLVYLTEEQLEDGPQALMVVTDLLPAAFRFSIEDELINANGGTNLHGVLNAACLVTVNKETGQAAATIVYENIVKMDARLFASSSASAVWFINQDTKPQLHTMSLAVGTGGVPVYLPATGAAGAQFGTLFGRPVIPIEHCATLGTVGDIILADMSQMLYATKGGIRTAQSIHVKFVEGETAFRAVLRHDAKPWWPAALTPAKGTATQSPFVALQTRS